MKTKVVVRDSESGYVIEEVDSIQEGENLIEEYELQDETDGCYEPNFYEVAIIED